MNHGDITRLAKQVGITTTYMALILKGKKTPSAAVATRLEQVTKIKRPAWVWPNEYPNPMIQSPSNGSESLEG